MRDHLFAARLVASSMCVCVPAAVYAQSASVDYTLYPRADLRPVGDSADPALRLRIHDWRASLSVPLSFNNGNTTLESSVSYQNLRIDFDDSAMEPDSVHAVECTAFLRHQVNATWGGLAVLAPGYADDFEGGASSDAVTLTAVLAATYTFSNTLSVGLGAAVQNVFGEPLPLPVASIDWTIRDRLWLKAILPANAELTYLAHDRVGLRVSVSATGNRYHGDPDVFMVENPQMNYSAVAADAGARWFLLPFLHITVHGGYTLYRRFDFSDGDDDAGSFTLDNGPVMGVSVGSGN